MIPFMIGLLIGGAAGVTIMALCNAASRNSQDDKH